MFILMPSTPLCNSDSNNKKMFIYLKYSVQYCVSGEENQTFIIKLNNRHWIQEGLSQLQFFFRPLVCRQVVQPIVYLLGKLQNHLKFLCKVSYPKGYQSQGILNKQQVGHVCLESKICIEIKEKKSIIMLVSRPLSPIFLSIIGFSLFTYLFMSDINRSIHDYPCDSFAATWFSF